MLGNVGYLCFVYTGLSRRKRLCFAGNRVGACHPPHEAAPSRRSGEGFVAGEACRYTFNDHPAPVVSISDRLGADGESVLCSERLCGNGAFHLIRRRVAAWFFCRCLCGATAPSPPAGKARVLSFFVDSI